MSPLVRKLIRERRARAGEAAASPEPARREGRVAGGWRRFRRATDRFRLLTDVVGALLIVGVLAGGIAASAGGVWPPIIVVESGSMMHAVQETSYGRFGTIDVGDMVFIRSVRDRSDLTTWADGGELRYGRPGDVIAYAPHGNNSATAVVHRLIAYVEVSRTPTGDRNYTLHWIDGERMTWGNAGIYFPPLGFDENWGFSQSDGYRPAYSGYLTKGDNAFTNPAVDQAMPARATPISAIIDPAWIVGEVYGEVPWLGLGKLALQNGQTNPEVPGWERVGNAFAPLELWTMFFLTIAVLLLVPLTIDTWRAWRRLRAEQETERRIEEENRRRVAAQKAALAAQAQGARRVTTFAAVVSSRPVRSPSSSRRPPGR